MAFRTTRACSALLLLAAMPLALRSSPTPQTDPEAYFGARAAEIEAANWDGLGRALIAAPLDLRQDWRYPAYEACVAYAHGAFALGDMRGRQALAWATQDGVAAERIDKARGLLTKSADDARQAFASQLGLRSSLLSTTSAGAPFFGGLGGGSGGNTTGYGSPDDTPGVFVTPDILHRLDRLGRQRDLERLLEGLDPGSTRPRLERQPR